MATKQAPKNESQRQFAQFDQNLKKTAFGTKFGRQLFTNPGKFTTKDLVTAVRYLGLQVPKEAQLTADVVQVWTTGAAAVDNYQAYKDATAAGDAAANFKDVVKPSTAAMRLATGIAEDQHWIDSDTASMMRVGLAVALICASGGTDVGSWITLGTELVAQSESAKVEAKMLAYSAASRGLTQEIDKEKAKVSESIKKLESGQIGVFGFLVDFATQGSLLFENAVMKNPAFAELRKKLPGINLIPLGDWTFRGEGSKTTWYGDTKSDSAEITVKGLIPVAPELAFDMFFRWVIDPYGEAYLNADKYYTSIGQASFFDTAILALFQERMRLDSGVNVLDAFLRAQITPYEINVKNTFDQYVMPQKSALSAITSNFGLTKYRETYTKEQMIILDRTGQIDKLSAVRESQELIRKKFDFSDSQIDRDFPANTIDWRNLANFISVMDALDLIYSDPMIATWTKTSQRLPAYQVFPRIKEFKARFEKIWKYSTIRKVNVAALGNVAYFLNSTKIEMKNPNELGPAIYGYSK